MTWQKGQSGNPGGRPKIDPEVVRLAKAHTEEAIAALVDIVNDKAKPPAARVTAAIALLDRGHGKAPTTLNANVTSGQALESLIEFISSTSPEQIDAYIAAYQASGLDKSDSETCAGS